MPAKLDALGAAMTEEDGDPSDHNSRIPPVFTYFGQFVDHDITANTDRESDLSQIDGAISAVPRAKVEEGLSNLRDGSLRLDSIYGDTIGQGDFAKKLAHLMRHPQHNAKMRLAFPEQTAGPPLPKDKAADLFRLGFLVRRGDVTKTELEDLDIELKKSFLGDDGKPKAEVAIIGDARNDENLLVAQLHMSLLRFHNKLVDVVGDFEEARKLVRWHYQWLILHEYLPAICDPAVVADVLARKAPLYADFFAKHATFGSARMPLPLEFSVAAFRFGHSMVRVSYDHNRFFGEAVEGSDQKLTEAPFELLFAFTGNGKMNGQGPQLPHNWVIEWERFIKIDPSRPKRAARRIDTRLAPPLSDLNNEPSGVFKHLAQRNLRRGYRLSLPTAQGCVSALTATYDIPGLTEDELKSGTSGKALEANGLLTATPLWFYVLKEAEVRADGQHLGPLGSVLVADTLAGLVIQDPKSCWHGGADGSPWSPKDAQLKSGPITSFEELLKFAGML